MISMNTTYFTASVRNQVLLIASVCENLLTMHDVLLKFLVAVLCVDFDCIM